MSNETKERLPLRMKPATSRRLEQWCAADNCRSKNEFVEKAINFYVDYLETQDNQSLLPTALLAVLDGRLGRLEDHIARREFTREVELDLLIGIIADAVEVDRDDLKRRRAESVRNVKATNVSSRWRSGRAPLRNRTGMVTNGKTDSQKSLHQKHRRRGRVSPLHRNPGAGGDPSG